LVESVRKAVVDGTIPIIQSDACAKLGNPNEPSIHLALW
jgi:hypothetical protein